MFVTMSSQEPIETMALDLSLSYPKETTSDGAYELIVEAGAMAKSVMKK